MSGLAAWPSRSSMDSSFLFGESFNLVADFQNGFIQCVSRFVQFATMQSLLQSRKFAAQF